MYESFLAALRSCSDGSELDETLYQRFQAVCNYPDNSDGQRRAMSKLISAAQKIPGLLRSSHQNYPDALNKTLNASGVKIKAERIQHHWERKCWPLLGRIALEQGYQTPEEL